MFSFSFSLSRSYFLLLIDERTRTQFVTNENQSTEKQIQWLVIFTRARYELITELIFIAVSFFSSSPLSLPRSLSLFTKKQSPNLIDHMKWMTYVSRVGSLIKKNQMACACPSSRKKAQIWWDDTLLFIRLFWIYLNGKIVAHVGFDQKEREDKC